MTASAKTTHSHSWLSRLIVSLTIGLMMLALGATAAFAGTGIQATHVAGNAAPVISTGDEKVALNGEVDDDEDEDDEDEEGGNGGGLPATDTAPLAASGAGVTLNGEVDDDEDEDDEDEEGGNGGGLPATDTAPLAASGGASTAIPAVALLVIAGLAGGAVTVAAKRSIRA